MWIGFALTLDESLNVVKRIGECSKNKRFCGVPRRAARFSEYYGQCLELWVILRANGRSVIDY